MLLTQVLQKVQKGAEVGLHAAARCTTCDRMAEHKIIL